MNKPKTSLKPGRYTVWHPATRGGRRADVFEDIDAGCLCVKFQLVDRVQRLDEIDPAAEFVYEGPITKPLTVRREP